MMPQRDGSTAAVRTEGRFTHALAGLGLACLALVLSCGDASGPGDLTPGPIANVRIIGGQDQTGVVGTELPQPLRLRVVDADDRPVPGQIVNFRIVLGGGSVFAGAALTNADGVAHERWTLGIYALTEQRLEVRVIDPVTGDPVVSDVFRATALAGAAHLIFVYTGPGGAGGPSTAVQSGVSFATQPEIAVQDIYGNPVGGVVVTAALSNCPGTLGGTTTATSAPHGLASFSNLSITIADDRDGCLLTFSAPGVESADAFIQVVAG